MTLTEFLSARIAEDEAVARGQEADLVREFGKSDATLYSPLSSAGVGYMEYPAITIDSTRVLAECEAKRRIVDAHVPIDESADSWCQTCDGDGWPCVTMAAIAAVYADHPDYNEAWAL